ncbi:hypothetical protein BWO90_04075 (plasmid) [Sinorhizobium meliloti]|nr:hypothetical protein BWO90_04075 [Sinorhizobium meliloti]
MLRSGATPEAFGTALRHRLLDMTTQGRQGPSTPLRMSVAPQARYTRTPVPGPIMLLQPPG